MQNNGIKDILFGIQLVLVGAVTSGVLYWITAGLASAGQIIVRSPGEFYLRLYLSPLPGLLIIGAGVFIGYRGYRRSD